MFVLYVNQFVYLFLFWTIVIPLYVYLKTRFTIFELSKDRLKNQMKSLYTEAQDLDLE